MKKINYLVLASIIFLAACGGGAAAITYLSTYKVLFMEDPEKWAAMNNTTYPEGANNFHFVASGENRVEFESLDGPLYLYIEGGKGQEVCYGMQEDAINHWYICTTPGSGELRFCPDYWANCDTPSMVLHKDGTLVVKDLIIQP